MDDDLTDHAPCPTNCSGGCPVCAPDEHTGLEVYQYILKHLLLVDRNG